MTAAKVACSKVWITVPEGADVNRVFWQHVRASLGEGCCPRCGCRLEVVDTGLGTGGLCRHCDHAWAMEGERTNQWRLTNPLTGQALPLTR